MAWRPLCIIGRVTRRHFLRTVGGFAAIARLSRATVASFSALAPARTIAWRPVHASLDGIPLSGVRYHVYRSYGLDGNDWQRLTPSPISRTSFVDENFLPVGDCFYSVTAVSSDGVESERSAVACQRGLGVSSEPAADFKI
jgi:hypothetical protein